MVVLKDLLFLLLTLLPKNINNTMFWLLKIFTCFFQQTNKSDKHNLFFLKPKKLTKLLALKCFITTSLENIWLKIKMYLFFQGVYSIKESISGSHQSQDSHIPMTQVNIKFNTDWHVSTKIKPMSQSTDYLWSDSPSSMINSFL